MNYLTTHTSISPIRRGLAPGFSLGTPASSTTKTGRHDIAELLLKVALKHQKSNQSMHNTNYCICIVLLRNRSLHCAVNPQPVKGSCFYIVSGLREFVDTWPLSKEHEHPAYVMFFDLGLLIASLMCSNISYCLFSFAIFRYWAYLIKVGYSMKVLCASNLISMFWLPTKIWKIKR